MNHAALATATAMPAFLPVSLCWSIMSSVLSGKVNTSGTRWHVISEGLAPPPLMAYLPASPSPDLTTPASPVSKLPPPYHAPISNPFNSRKFPSLIPTILTIPDRTQGHTSSPWTKKRRRPRASPHMHHRSRCPKDWHRNQRPRPRNLAGPMASAAQAAP